GTRDLAIALVDMTQHIARLEEALVTLLQPYGLRDRPDAMPLDARRGRVEFAKVSFSHSGRPKIFDRLDLTFAAGTRTGLVGPSGGGKSTLLALLQRFY